MTRLRDQTRAVVFRRLIGAVCLAILVYAPLGFAIYCQLRWGNATAVDAAGVKYYTHIDVQIVLVLTFVGYGVGTLAGLFWLSNL